MEDYSRIDLPLAKPQAASTRPTRVYLIYGTVIVVTSDSHYFITTAGSGAFGADTAAKLKDLTSRVA